MSRWMPFIILGVFFFTPMLFADDTIRVGTFDVDASPPIGAPLAYDTTIGVDTPLTCRGIVILGSDDPIVLCSVDWIGIANGGQTEFKAALAEAVGSTPDRVAVHTVHQHDAPKCDFSADALLEEHGLSGIGFDVEHARSVIRAAAKAVETACENALPVTHVGLGAGTVECVASNRRILGPDGKVLHTRWTASGDPVIRAFPVGTIDPKLKMISFWNDNEPIVALTYYACHPQSYYRTGLANPDFPGLARNARQDATGTPHIHFNGAGGNLGAGKWNDGAHENRQVLADRVAEGMRLAWDGTERTPLSPEGVAWSTAPVAMPLAEHLNDADLLATVEDKNATPESRWQAAKKLAWVRRCNQGETIDLSCLSLNEARLLHMPGELLIEYQLAAQEMQPDLFTAMAAYGEYAPGYIATEIAYSQGGYEASPDASCTAPGVEKVLLDGLHQLLDAE